jgi:hypothetical protein
LLPLATNGCGVMQSMTARTGAMNASTASSGVLPTKGHQRDEAHYVEMTRCVGHVAKFAGIPTPNEFISAHPDKEAGLTIEQGTPFLRRQKVDRGSLNGRVIVSNSSGRNGHDHVSIGVQR